MSPALSVYEKHKRRNGSNHSGYDTGDVLETTRNRRHPAPESASGHIGLGSPSFFSCFGGNPRTHIPALCPTPPHYPSETGSRVELLGLRRQVTLRQQLLDRVYHPVQQVLYRWVDNPVVIGASSDTAVHCPPDRPLPKIGRRPVVAPCLRRLCLAN